MVREGRARITLVFIICALVFLAYCSSLQGGFVYDDVFFIKENPLIRDLSNVPAIFTSAFWEASSHPGKTFYRPLAVLSYAVNFSLGGFDPFGYHLLNVLLHVGNVLLVFALADRLFRHTVLSAAVALLFGLHPINTEVVAWVSGRGDILATFFFLGALVLYVRVYPPEDSGPSEARRPWLLHGSSTLAFLLGLLAKESAATLIGVLALYELAFRPSVPKKGLRLLPFVIIVAAYLGWRVTVLGELQVQPVAFVLNPLVEEPLLPRFLTGIKIFGKYLWLLLCPLRLSVDYSFNQIPVVHTPWEPGVVISALAVIGLTGLWLLCWVRDRVVFFGLGFFFVTGSLRILLRYREPHLCQRPVRVYKHFRGKVHVPPRRGLCAGVRRVGLPQWELATGSVPSSDGVFAGRPRAPVFLSRDVVEELRLARRVQPLSKRRGS
jgi:hypothetical protein